MILFEDTRNQIGKHKVLNEKLKELGHVVRRTKLYVGDYSRVDSMAVCVDTKKDWLELASNICGRQHVRFREECLRAKEAGIKLIILVEEAANIDCWTSPKRANGKLICEVNPYTLEKAMQTMTERYGVEFRHCAKDKTAETLLEILGGIEWREH